MTVVLPRKRPQGKSVTPAAAAGAPAPVTSSRAPAGPPAARWPVLTTFVVLGLVAALVYGRAMNAPLIFDDTQAITDNPSIVRLWPLVGDEHTRGPLYPPPLAPTSRRPLPNFTFALNYAVGELAPFGYHVVNLLLHVLVGTLLAVVVCRTLRLPCFAGTWDPVAWPLSFTIALLWSVHPVNSESVVYVTQRTELLAAFFYLLTMWAALRYWSAGVDGRVPWLIVAGVAAVAGVTSKETVVSVPIVLLLFERAFLVQSFRATFRSWPLYAALMPSWALLVLLSAGGIGGLSDARHRLPVLVWWATQAKVLLLYVKLVLWPWPLSIHYAPAFLRTVEAAWPWVAGVLLLAGVVAALVWRRPAIRFVVVTVMMLLAPTLVVPLPKMVAAERRLYLPLAGLLVLAVLGAYRRLAGRPRLALALAGALAAIWGTVTVARLAAYETAVTIWQDAVRHQPDDAMSHYNLGVALLDERRLREAAAAFEQALKIEPDHTRALDNLGLALNQLGRPEEAIARLEEALRLEPDDAVAHNNIGSALITLGRPEDAIPHLNQALTLEPDQPKHKVHLNLGKALLDTGHGPEAIAHLEQAVRLQPDDAGTHAGLGAALLALGRPAEAVAAFQRTVQRTPNDPEAESNLASALLQAGAAAGAVEHYRRALALAPDYDAAYNNLGVALLQLDRTDEAIAQFERALRLSPEYANAHFNLGSALLKTGRAPEAAKHLARAAQLAPEDAQARFHCAVAYARTDRRAEAVAMANDGLALARAHGDTALASEIAAWLAAGSPGANP